MTRPTRWRSSGTWAMPARRRSRGSPIDRPLILLAMDADRSAGDGQRCRPALPAARDWPLPETPAMPTISPARTFEADILDAQHAAVVHDLQLPGPRARRSPGSRRRLVDPQQHLAADHQLGQLLAAGGRPSRRWRPPRPWRMTLTVSVTAMISRSLWVMRTMVLPWSRSARRMRNRWSASCGVSTPVGSSRIRMSAPR